MHSKESPETAPSPNSVQDFLHLMIRNVNTIVNDEMRAERDHTNEKIKLIVKHVEENAKSLDEKYNSIISTQSQKLDDVELRIQTISTYFENLYRNLNDGLHTTINELKRHLQHCFKCHICDEDFSTLHELFLHINRDHPVINHIQCNVCQTSFQTNADLNSHIVETHTHQSDQIHQCSLCLIVFWKACRLTVSSTVTSCAVNFSLL